jgi:hypothetical protein
VNSSSYRDGIRLVAEVDVQLLRPGAPGRVVHQNGDLDSQLKVLFDALRRPSDQELPKGASPADGERPFFLCVLDDDRVIRRASARSERLLGHISQNDVITLMRISVLAVERHWMNAHLVG